MLRTFTDAEQKKLRRQFRQAKPFRHLVVRNVLADHTLLFAALQREAFFPKDTDLFSFRQTHNLAYARTNAVRQFVAFLSSQNFATFVSAITGLRLRAGALDVFGALYENGDYLLCHDDELEGRKVALLFYISPDFHRRDGGGLALFRAKGTHPGAKAVVYPPMENSLVLFEVSRRSWHEVEEVVVHKQRYTIGGWLH